VSESSAPTTGRLSTYIRAGISIMDGRVQIGDLRH
jgi:hypothetical protein